MNKTLISFPPSFLLLILYPLGISSRFLACVQEPLHYALYGKREQMRTAAVNGLMHLAYVAPNDVSSFFFLPERIL